MSQKPVIIALSASPNHGGRTEQYLARFVRAAKRHGAKVSVVRLYDVRLPLFTGKLARRRASNKAERLPKRLSPLLAALRTADGLFIATPTHWFNVPVPLKNFIDHLTILEEYGYHLEGKVAGVVTFSPHGGGTDVVSNLALVLTNMGCVLPPYSLLWFGQKEEQWSSRDIDLVAKNMILQIAVERAQGMSWDYD